MTDVVIHAERLGKLYRIGERRAAYRTLRESLGGLAASAARRVASLGRTADAESGRQTIWALREVSFEVTRGEVLGIIGRNGAGKSTLLKLLSRITEPTEGRAAIRGRVGSLLEVGTGFHPELTGRENVYLNGAILGMRKVEIDRNFDEIVAFAEVERFIDTPVKRYSTGMLVRLAFAVAAHLEPEILLIDEVLAVGDASFQKKCLGKMGDVAQAGRTVLFVSHNMLAVESLCGTTVWLDEGRVRRLGATAETVHEYVRGVTDGKAERVWPSPEQAPGCPAVRLRRLAVEADAGPGSRPRVDGALRIVVELWNLKPDARLTVTLHLLTPEGIVAFSTSTLHSESEWEGRPFPVGLFRSVCTIPPQLLNATTYRIRVLAVADQARALFRLDDVVSFTVDDAPGQRGAYFQARPGAVAPRLPWTTELLAEGETAQAWQGSEEVTPGE